MLALATKHPNLEPFDIKKPKRPNLEPFDFESHTNAQTSNPSIWKTQQATKPRTLRPWIEYTHPNIEPFDFKKTARRQNLEPFDFESNTRAQTSNRSILNKAQASKPRTLQPWIARARPKLEPLDFQKSQGDQTPNPSTLKRACEFYGFYREM